MVGNMAEARILGAILAGGGSRRFGGDKALAAFGGKRLVDLAAASLEPHAAAIVLCGRTLDGFDCLADRPGPDLGPLGGLNAALHHGLQEGYDAVLSCGCDTPILPNELFARLSGGGPAIVADQPVVGLWPAELAAECDAFLAEGGRALYAFAERVGARRIALDEPIPNINRPEDLEKLSEVATDGRN